MSNADKNEPTMIIKIYGSSGAGKTKFARLIYNKLFSYWGWDGVLLESNEQLDERLSKTLNKFISEPSVKFIVVGIKTPQQKSFSIVIENQDPMLLWQALNGGWGNN